MLICLCRGRCGQAKVLGAGWRDLTQPMRVTGGVQTPRGHELGPQGPPGQALPTGVSIHRERLGTTASESSPLTILLKIKGRNSTNINI